MKRPTGKNACPKIGVHFNALGAMFATQEHDKGLRLIVVSQAAGTSSLTASVRHKDVGPDPIAQLIDTTNQEQT